MYGWTEPLISIDEYLAGEVHASVRHEYVAGRVCAMAGASNAHNRITMNLTGHLWSATRRSHCRALVCPQMTLGMVDIYKDVELDPAG
jgi:Uma2 family endonuclease